MAVPAPLLLWAAAAGFRIPSIQTCCLYRERPGPRTPRCTLATLQSVAYLAGRRRSKVQLTRREDVAHNKRRLTGWEDELGIHNARGVVHLCCSAPCSPQDQAYIDAAAWGGVAVCQHAVKGLELGLDAALRPGRRRLACGEACRERSGGVAFEGDAQVVLLLEWWFLACGEGMVATMASRRGRPLPFRCPLPLHPPCSKQLHAPPQCARQQFLSAERHVGMRSAKCSEHRCRQRLTVVGTEPCIFPCSPRTQYSFRPASWALCPASFPCFASQYRTTPAWPTPRLTPDHVCHAACYECCRIGPRDAPWRVYEAWLVPSPSGYIDELLHCRFPAHPATHRHECLGVGYTRVKSLGLGTGKGYG